MDQALAMADYANFESRRAASARRGKRRGIGIANTIERAATPPGAETAEIRCDTVTLVVGTTSRGQSHETMYKILLAEKLGLDFADMVVIQGDTDKVVWGTGTFGSRSAVIGGSAVWRGADKIIDKGRKIAAHILETAEHDLEFAAGTYTVAGTDRKLTLKEVARTAFQPGRLPPAIENPACSRPACSIPWR